MSAKSLRFPCVTTAFATLALLAAACSTEATDTPHQDGDVASTTEELNNVGVGDGPGDSPSPIGPGGGLGPVAPGIGPLGPFQAASKPPRVMTRTATGSSIVVGFDRVVTAAELPVAAMHVDVVRLAGTTFTKSNVLRSATLAADGRSLTMNLNENLKAGTAYYTRGNWKRCTTFFPFGTRCQTFRAEFGDVVVRRTLPVIVNGTLATDFSRATRGPFFSANAAGSGAGGQPRVMPVAIDEPLPIAPPPPAGAPGTFRVKAMTPLELSRENTRDLRTVVVEFEGGTLDCANTPLTQSTFQLYSRASDINEGTHQLMFHDPAGQDPSNGWSYRGNLRCQEAENRLIFTTPGRLYGDAQYLVALNARSKEGDRIQAEKDFYTERPGLRVSVTRVSNEYGTHDTCDSDGFFGSENYCDIYVTSAIAGANDPQTGRIPESGSIDEMRFFPEDPAHGVHYPDPFKVLFVSDKPTGVALNASFLAYDADSTTAWKKVLAVAGKIATSAGAAIAAVEPPAGAITAAVGAGLITISEAIPTNEDDKLGVGGFQFTREDHRWGTGLGEVRVPVTNNAPHRGPVNVFLLVEEFPAPWHLNSPIQ